MVKHLKSGGNILRKMKQLELAQMSTQTIARQLETEMKVLR